MTSEITPSFFLTPCIEHQSPDGGVLDLGPVADEEAIERALAIIMCRACWRANPYQMGEFRASLDLPLGVLDSLTEAVQGDSL